MKERKTEAFNFRVLQTKKKVNLKCVIEQGTESTPLSYLVECVQVFSEL